MKKKNRLQALAALLAATLTMALTTPVAASAAAFEETYVGEERTESKVYGGMIAPKTTVATNNEVAYNETNIEATTADSGRIYYLKNSHGDIIGQMDEQGNLLASFAYNAFGELVSAVTFQPEQKESANRFLYAGEQYDETSGLYYLRARQYDVSAGRFTQEDTYLGDGRNLYAYVHSNPLKYVDPTGHVSYDCQDNDGTFLDDRQEDAMGGPNSALVKTYQTYTKVNTTTGQVYSGRTSGYGSAIDNVAHRDTYHHMNAQGYEPAVLDKSSSSYEAIRGREQMLIDYYGGAQSIGGSSGNAINGIGANNTKGSIYMNAAIGEFGIIE